ncbi:hypothetical protein A2U01_0095563, partial [Trifolium medium]|nr:hypothetical protein [Trifolium medium]
LRAASLKVPESSLHFKCSAALMMAVWVPTAIKCSEGSDFQSNTGRCGVLKFSGTLAFHKA